jgi:hypothetical protein
VTNRDEPIALVEAEHRAHAVIELVIRDLKEQALAHFPSGQFAANAAWTVIAALAPTCSAGPSSSARPSGSCARPVVSAAASSLCPAGSPATPAAAPCTCPPDGRGKTSSSKRSGGFEHYPPPERPARLPSPSSSTPGGRSGRPKRAPHDPITAPARRPPQGRSTTAATTALHRRRLDDPPEPATAAVDPGLDRHRIARCLLYKQTTARGYGTGTSR